MIGHYDLRLVLLSVLIAISASYAALDLAGRVTTARKSRGEYAWLWGGSIAVGVGIWAMHYVGMAAFELPVPISYDWPLVLLSLAIAIVRSWIALFLASRPSMSPLRWTLGSVAMGGGIAGMHYVGMEAMRLPATMDYSLKLVGFCFVLAIVISGVALRLAFTMRNEANQWEWTKAGCALLMGLGLASIHYVGMYSATFVAAPLLPARFTHSITVSDLGLNTIVVVTLVSLVLALVASTLDRQTASHSLELLRSRRQLDVVFDSMTAAIMIQDGSKNIIQLNRAASKILNTSNVPIPFAVAEAIMELQTLDGTPIPLEDWPSAHALKGEFCQNTEIVVFNKKTGRSFFAEISTAPVIDSAGDARQTMLTIRDITERKQMDVAKALVAAIVESSEDAIIGMDLEGRINSWNGGAEKIFGYTAAEMIGESIRRVVPLDRQDEEDEFLDRIRNDEIVDHVETVRRKKDGSLIHVSVTISPIRDQWRKIIGASKIARDITKTRRLEQQLLQSQKMDAVGQLTGGIAHDFNNLLGVVIGNLDLMERMIPENELLVKRLHMARRAATRGADLTRRLLAFSSTDELKPAPTHLEHAIRNVLELATQAIGPGIRITTQFDPKVTSIFVDAASFESALLNLAVNARDAMQKGGSLIIATQRVELDDAFPSVRAGEVPSGSYVCVSVSDTGEGMSREVQERAFEPFFSTKLRGRGTGLGLAMVYGFAKQSGGTARIYSEPGIGTTVSLYLPLSSSVPPSHLSSGTKKIYERPGGTVLVVDDEADLLDIAVAYLKDLGYEALAEQDPFSALEVLKHRRDIALIITDIIMPGMSGVELAQAAHELNPAIKVIYSSGFPAGALEERNVSLSETALLRKPYRASEFSAAISAIMIPNR